MATLVALFFGGAVGSSSAQPSPPVPAAPAQEHGPPSGETEYPSVHFSGFADVNLALQAKSDGPRGFSEGQLALHMAAALSPRVYFFGELSLTPRADAGTGTPAATGFNPELERLVIRFDRSDQLKVSFGRYHTPISYWNTAFHHGSWLQTTISRPEMVRFGSRFVPVHFVGALVQGAFAASGANLNYQVGIGNGRGDVLSRGGDAGDNNARPAWLVTGWSRPDRFYGLQYGGSIYVDRISTPGLPEFDERIVAAHVVWDRENPEVIAEFTRVRHEQVGGAPATSSNGFYVQAAYRLPDPARLWKPYVRFEHIGIPDDEQVFADIAELEGTTVGVRYDVSTFVALKAEMRARRQNDDQGTRTGVFVQVSFTF